MLVVKDPGTETCICKDIEYPRNTCLFVSHRSAVLPHIPSFPQRNHPYTTCLLLFQLRAFGSSSSRNTFAMSQEITKAKFILGGQDQQLVDNLLKIFSNWATEIRKFNDEGPKIRTDGIITAWRQKSDAAQAKAIAESRSLESDGDIERSFKPYVSCLKCFLKESNFATYVSVRMTRCSALSSRL